jgi:dienelactone hydrolase
MHTMAQRYALLEPDITLYGPQDEMIRPAVVLFHGCGGMRPHIHLYAQAVALTGARAYIVDSFTPRGWDRNFAVSLICSGAVLQGYERAGDVLSVLYGLQQSGRVDMDKVILCGFSHGGWSIMDLMTSPLTKPGHVKIADPDPALVARVKGLFLVYPYINFPARTNSTPWQFRPKTFAVLAKKDHLTPIKHAEKTFAKLQAQGVDVTTLQLNGTHAFDEEDNKGMVMRYDADILQTSLEALLNFTTRLFDLPQASERAVG